MITVNKGGNIFFYKIKYVSHLSFKKVNRTNMIEISRWKTLHSDIFLETKKNLQRKFGISYVFKRENGVHYSYWF